MRHIYNYKLNLVFGNNGKPPASFLKTPSKPPAVPAPALGWPADFSLPNPKLPAAASPAEYMTVVTTALGKCRQLSNIMTATLTLPNSRTTIGQKILRYHLL